jgi:hypothetical protein|tara:strand:- start:2203 stop:2511 length:309 start_codon:yes stop_codon:yes gene_type:complete
MKMSREALTNSIDGEKHLSGVDECIDDLRTCEKDEVPAIMGRATLHLAKLKKILPDPKSVEMSIDVQKSRSREELLRDVKQMEQSLGIGAIEGEVIEPAKLN